MLGQLPENFKLLPVTVAIILSYGGKVHAEDNAELLALITPENIVSIGLGAIDNTNSSKRFSQYTGLNNSTSVLQDIEINKRDETQGLWTNVVARNIGLESREVSLSQQKQGAWKYSLDYNEIVRLDPYVIHTGMTGGGTSTPTVNLIATPPMPVAWATDNGLVASNGISGNDVELKIKRTALSISGDAWLTPEIQLELSFRNEDKHGARMFGRAGMTSVAMKKNPDGTGASLNGGWAVLLTPEPINSNIRSIETKVNFSRDKLALSAGYYGSFYVNQLGNLTPEVPGSLNRGVLWSNCATVGCSTVQQMASAPTALPPDNQAHQYYLSGNYAFSDTMRSNFKLAYTMAMQNESYAGMGLTPSAGSPGSLGGLVNTTLAQMGLTMKPLSALTVNASLRYEDRADKTPVYVYNTSGVSTNYALNNTTNWPSASQTRTTAKLEGIYRVSEQYSALLGLDWDRKQTPLPSANTSVVSKQVFFRPVLAETGVHAELRKSFSETVNGAVSAEYKQRRGNEGDWMTTSGDPGNALVYFDPSAAAVLGNAGGNYVLPDMYMDRNRTKLRSNLEWDVSKKWAMQVVAEHGQDHYLRAFPGSITPAQVVAVDAGARVIVMDSLSVDSTYRFSEDWRLSAYWTKSLNRWNVNKANMGDDTRNVDTTIGMGLNGQASTNWLLGLNIVTVRDETTFNNVVATSDVGGAGNIGGWAGQTLPGNYLPTITYRVDKVNVSAKYAIDKSSDFILKTSLQYFSTDDWQWGYNGMPFLYSDNTTVSQPTSQMVRYLSASYVLKF